MKLLLLSLFILSYGFAKDCKFTINAQDITAQWSAFKTPAKVGVGGKFTELGLTKKTYVGKTLAKAISGASFSIDSTSVFTKDSGRDKKIVDNFFKGVGNITGKVVKARKDSLILEITMNKVTKSIPLNLSVQNKNFSAKGTIDVFDFSMNKHLDLINKACFELHEGKTWNDVDIELVGSFQKTCK